MGEIKTALEIALEKTENVKSDKSVINQYEAKQRGKKLANSYLEGDVDLAAEIKKTAKDQQSSLKQGILDILLSQIALPSGKDDEKKMEIITKGLLIIIINNRLPALLKQLAQLFSQYFQEAAQYEQAISRQYSPKLRQKEAELSRRMGREVKIDPLQDAEFIAFYNQTMNELKNKYQAAIDQAKEEIKNMVKI